MAMRDADDRLAEIRGLEADRIEHRAIGRARIAFGDDAGPFVESHFVLLAFNASAAGRRHGGGGMIP